MKSDKDTNLFWVDLEMTGLNPDENVIIEIASVVTDKYLRTVAEGPVIAIHQPESELNKMDDWNVSTHTSTGLVDKVRKSQIDTKEAEELTLEFLKEHINFRKSPLCGSSVHVDRRFMYNYMPGLNDYLHYRIIDVSSIYELANRWYPDLPRYEANPEDKHSALKDIYHSIESLSYYRETIFKPF